VYYHSIVDAQSSIFSFMPLMIDSFIPGIDERYNVSSMERQTSSETKTAECFSLTTIFYYAMVTDTENIIPNAFVVAGLTIRNSIS